MGHLLIKRFALLSLLFIISKEAEAQCNIQGTIMLASGETVAKANVLLLKKADSSLVKGVLSDNNGIFRFAGITAGNYLVVGSSTGYKSSYSNEIIITADSLDVMLAALTLQQESKELTQVTVVAKKPLFEQKMDRMVINVSSSITAAGSTALDVLERSPGIVVDRQNNSLSMSGKNGVVVMLNGKISRMPMNAVVQMLAGMNSNNIEKIELITTPPSNFDAEGDAGYINIVMKENTQYGTNGSYSASAGYGNGLALSSGINFNHRNRKINIYGDHSFSRNAVNQVFGFNRKVTTVGKQLETSINSERDPVTVYNNLRFGADYQWNKKTIIGAVISGFDSRWTMDAFNRSNIFLNQKLDTVVHISNHEIHNLYNYSANLNLVHNFASAEKLSMDLDYVHYKDHNPVTYLNTYFNGSGSVLYNQEMSSGKETPITFLVGSADYTKKLGPKVDLEAGVKSTQSKFVNDVSVQRKEQNTWVSDNEMTASYNLQESIMAGYTSFGITFSQKASAKAGLRYEYTQSNLNSAKQKNIVDRQYGNLFPTAFFAYKLDSNSSINLSYNRRITRPTFNDMAPFVIFLDPNTFFSGNPALQPSISDGVKADYLFKRFIFSVSYTYQANPITNFSPRVDPVTNKQTLAAENQKSNKVINVVLSLPFTVTSWWNMQNSAIGTWQKLDGLYKGERLLIEQKNLMFRSTQNFTLPKNISMELSGFIRSAGLFGIYRMNAFGAADFGMQKKFTKSSLKLSYENMFNTLKFKPSINEPAKNLVVSGSLQFVFPIVRLTYTHSFGNQKLASKRERASAAQEKERVQTN